MRSSRLFTPEVLQVGAEVELGQKAGHYLSRVLRMSSNAEIILFNGDGQDYRCVLENLNRDGASARVVECLPGIPDSSLKITLCQAISRGDRMDYSLQKATELGVTSVRLLLSERVEVKLGGSRLEKRLAHWQGVIQSASEQCGRSTLPKLYPPVVLHEWPKSNYQRLVLDARADLPMRSLKLADKVEIAVGPEGGFSDAEIGLIVRSGAQNIRLGPRVLRTETAGPAAIAVLQSMGGDFS
ncbi:MAG TPA: 16S rRNA (uracil(1498)-N(3))-methyltransferase [Xanthomonadales bacterium]|nr:16S rRNA (uracil(1498)-N(3))-methyltransferase [Xanthomonadales bacterium]